MTGPARPAGDALSAALRQAILDGEFAPNQRLVEADLTDQFGASRAAVRTALVQLSSEGLVDRIQNRGARVRSISLEEAIEITELRAVIEGLCAAKAAERLTDEQAADLAELRARIVAAVTAHDLNAYAALNQQLHRTVQEIGGHAAACRVLDRLRAQGVRHRFRLALQPGRAEVSGPEHCAIIDAIIARDPVAAESAMRGHLTSVIDALRRVGDPG